MSQNFSENTMAKPIFSGCCARMRKNKIKTSFMKVQTEVGPCLNNASNARVERVNFKYFSLALERRVGIMDERYALMTRVLRREVCPSLGCTEPAAVGIAVSLAFNAAINNLEGIKVKQHAKLDDILKIREIQVKMDRNVFKNSADVGIPNSGGRRGLKTAIIMSLLGDPERSLMIFESVKPEAFQLINILADRVNISIEDTWSGESELYIEAIVTTEKGYGRAIIKHTHTNVVLVESNKGVLYKREEQGCQGENTIYRDEAEFKKLKIADLIEYVEQMPKEASQIVNNGIELNTKLSDAGLERPIGIGVGYYMQKGASRNIISYLMARTAAAVDARMYGLPIPAMAVAGSGNQGIMATMPIVGYAERVSESDKNLLIKAVGLSYLLTIYTTYYSSYLSAVCGCATKAGVGASAGLAYYISGGNEECCKRAIQNFIADTTGIVCDGAKYSCSLKIATAACAVYKAAVLAVEGKEPPYTNGILGRSVEESIKNLGIVIKSMIPVDRTIVELMMEKMLT